MHTRIQYNELGSTKKELLFSRTRTTSECSLKNRAALDVAMS